MKYAVLTRTISGDQGVLGKWEMEGFSCVTIEPPDRGNAKGKSCSPAGTYLFKERTDSPKHGIVYEEWDDPSTPQREDVVGRDNIQIHSANLAGDEDKGYVRQLDGCIALGREIAIFKAGIKPAGSKDQMGITDSKSVMAVFMRIMGHDLLSLTIRWHPDIAPRS